MSKYEVSVHLTPTGDTDHEVFEAPSELDAAFRAGFSLGAYTILGLPAARQDMVGDPQIDKWSAERAVLDIKQV
jgi:hypothetical protein